MIVEPGAQEVISQGPGVLGGDCGDHAMPRRRRWRLFTEFGGGRPKLDTVMKRSRGANAWNIGYRKRRAARSAPGARLRGQGKGRDVRCTSQAAPTAGRTPWMPRSWSSASVCEATQMVVRWTDAVGPTIGGTDLRIRRPRSAQPANRPSLLFSYFGSRARRRGPRRAPGSW